MPLDSAPTRETSPRISLSASVLIVMLLSLPAGAGAGAGVRGMVESASGVRVGLLPLQALPVEIARKLCDGIRYELPTNSPVPTAANRGVTAGPCEALAFARPLREALLDLPPPARG